MITSIRATHRCSDRRTPRCITSCMGLGASASQTLARTLPATALGVHLIARPSPPEYCHSSCPTWAASREISCFRTRTMALARHLTYRLPPQEAFPQLPQEGPELQQGMPAPPSINIDFAPTAVRSGFEQPKSLDVDSLTPPERGT